MLRYFAIGLLLVSSLLAACSIEPQVAVTIVSPPEGYAVQNGTALHVLVQVADREGKSVDDASSVTVTVTDPSGNTVATLPCSYRGEGTYASAPHDFPVGSVTGTWSITAVAQVNGDTGSAGRSFVVEPSRAERLQAKYGFWLDDFDFFHCHGSDSFINHWVDDPDEGHVILEEHCSHFGTGDQIHIGVFWSRRAFPATEEVAQTIARTSLPSFFQVQITGVTRTTFQEREAWQTTGTYYHAEEPRMRGVTEWITFQCPGDDRLFTIVTAATRNVQHMITEELVTLRESFRCPE